MGFKSSDNDLKISRELVSQLTGLPEDDRLDLNQLRGDIPQDPSVQWLLSTNTIELPTVEYPVIRASINDTGTIAPIVISGTRPFTSYRVSSGAMPSEFTLDTTTGVISYTTGSSASSGSFGVIASNPKGDGAEHTVTWQIEQSNGMAEYTNSENLYPFCYVTTARSIDSQPLVKQTIHGNLTSISDGTFIEDSAYPIYAQSNGNGTWNYLAYPDGYSYWMFFQNSTTNPVSLTNGSVTDLTFFGGLGVDWVSTTADDVIVGGVHYPSDRADVHYGTGLSYIDFGTDATLDNFLTDSAAWSYGFKLVDAWPDDALGRTMFTRQGRNWQALALGHSSIYSELMFGNGAARSFDSSEENTLPTGGFSAGDYVRVVYTGSKLRLYVNGTLYYEKNGINSYMDDSSANSLNLTFGYGVESDAVQSSYALSHGLWQGRISRLWIANGLQISTDDSGTSYPAGATHAWQLGEDSGSTFNPSIGSVVATGAKVAL